MREEDSARLSTLNPQLSTFRPLATARENGYLPPAMRTTSSYSDYQPIRYLGRMPVYATTILTAVFALGIIVYTVLASARIVPEFLLGFRAERFMDGALWQPLTYVFVNGPSFFTALGLLCFYQWAVETERYLGRVRFLKLFALLVLVMPLLCGVWRALGVPYSIAGNYELTAAFLVAFATLYPNIEFFGWIPLKWFAFACVTIGSLMYFPERNWPGLSLLWGECGAAFGFVRLIQRGGSVEVGDFLEKFKPKPKFRVLPSPGSRASEPDDDTMGEADALLDKIAKSGMASLSAKERAKLEKARAALMKKDRR